VRHSRRGKLVGVAAGVTALVGLSAVVTGVFAQEPDDSAAIVAQAKKRGFVFACPQRRGHNQSKGDLNVRLRAFCARGQKPLKLATWPLRGKRGPQGPQGPPGPPGGSGGGGGSSAAYGVANVFVQRGTGRRTRFATYAVDLGSPVGSTTGGQFRFSCSAAQSPCKVSLGAAVLSSDSGQALAYPRLTIHRQEATSANDPMIYCEYADGGANQISRVEFGTAVDEIRDPLTLNIGGSLDCGNTGQPFNQRVDEIWVTNGAAEVAYYDVWVTFNFGRGK
jgi:hypothetical protein